MYLSSRGNYLFLAGQFVARDAQFLHDGRQVLEIRATVFGYVLLAAFVDVHLTGCGATEMVENENEFHHDNEIIVME